MFARERIMKWCEQWNVDYLLGLARSDRLKRALASQMQQAKERCEETRRDGPPVRRVSLRNPRQLVDKAPGDRQSGVLPAGIQSAFCRYFAAPAGPPREHIWLSSPLVRPPPIHSTPFGYN